MNDIDNKNWTSKKELAEICNCDVRTITNIIEDLTKDRPVLTQNHMKKGGYHNSEVFYDDELAKAIQLKLKQNAMNAGGQKTANSIIKQSNMEDMEAGYRKWMGKKELMRELSVSADSLEKIINNLSNRWPAVTQSHIKRSGYHNTEIFYDRELVNLITAELAKHNTNQNTGAIQKQMNTQAKEQGILMNAVANSGDMNAAKALCNLIMEKTQLVAQNNLLQQENNQLRIENDRLQQEAIDAYNEGYDDCRYKHDWMRRYDIY